MLFPRFYNTLSFNFWAQKAHPSVSHYANIKYGCFQTKSGVAAIGAGSCTSVGALDGLFMCVKKNFNHDLGLFLYFLSKNPNKRTQIKGSCLVTLFAA